MELLYDAHAHLGHEDEQVIREKHNIYTLLCGTNPKSAAAVTVAAAQCPLFIPTFGLHPGYADQYCVSDMIPFFLQGGMVGEIGMDSVWCNVPLNIQRKIFIEQLDLAEMYGRSVILHTKGCEAEIGNIIAKYSMPILVHWYSCAEHLELYLERDCYFTIGPDVDKNPAVQAVVQRVPLNRLLVETDGLNAVCWAMEGEFDAQMIPLVLKHSIAYIASSKGVSKEAAHQAIAENFHRLTRV